MQLTAAFTTVARTERFRNLLENSGATYPLVEGEEMARATRAEFDALGQAAALGLRRDARR